MDPDESMWQVSEKIAQKELFMLKFALVGCGRIAKRHSDLLGHREIEGAQLVGVCDLDESRAKAIGDKFDVPYFTDMHEMMKQLNVDVISVLTDSGSHANVVVDLAQYGKHIVVEKPIALTLDDVDRMITTCDRHGIKLFVVQQNRFNVPVLKLREALEAGRRMLWLPG